MHPEIRLPGGLALLLSNILILTLFPGPSIVKALRIRSGQLAVVNLILLLLFSLRHSPLAPLANFCQPEVLWAHYMLGIIIYLELGLHVIVGISSWVDSRDLVQDLAQDPALLTGVVAASLLGISGVIQIRCRPSLDYNRVWYSIHILLTMTVVVATEIHLRRPNAFVFPHYLSATVLFTMGMLLRLCIVRRVPSQSIEINQNTLTMKITLRDFTFTPRGGTFFWVEGQAFSAWWLWSKPLTPPPVTFNVQQVEGGQCKGQWAMQDGWDSEKARISDSRGRHLTVVLVLPEDLVKSIPTDSRYDRLARMHPKINVNGPFFRSQSFPAGQPIHFFAEGDSVSRVLSYYQSLHHAARPDRGKHCLHWFWGEKDMSATYNLFLSDDEQGYGDRHYYYVGRGLDLKETKDIDPKDIEKAVGKGYVRNARPIGREKTSPINMEVDQTRGTPLTICTDEMSFATPYPINWRRGRGLGSVVNMALTSNPNCTTYIAVA